MRLKPVVAVTVSIIFGAIDFSAAFACGEGEVGINVAAKHDYTSLDGSVHALVQGKICAKRNDIHYDRETGAIEVENYFGPGQNVELDQAAVSTDDYPQLGINHRRSEQTQRITVTEEKTGCTDLEVPGVGKIDLVQNSEPVTLPTETPTETPPAPPVLDPASEIADIAINNDFYDSIRTVAKTVRETAEKDSAVVSEPYTKMPVPVLGDHLNRAAQNLGKSAELLDQASDGISRGELERFKRLYLNARDKAELGAAEIARDEQAKGASATSPFMGLMTPPGSNPFAKTKALSDIFGSGMSPAATSADGLVNRMIMLNGLPKDKLDQMMARLAFLEKPTLTLNNGTTATIPLLHNGYILGGGATGLDCSLFVSSALPVEVRRGSFTTLDFRAIWIYKKTGKLYVPPKYKPDRAELIKQVAQAFIPLDIYNGDKLKTGDMLVYRLPWSTTGHVFVVKSFNPKNYKAEVIEASQSAGTTRERDLALSIYTPDSKIKLLRPGLLGLRLRPIKNTVCKHSGGQPIVKKSRINRKRKLVK
ncbi:MAG: hypothetical protein A3K03_12920 [Bdellovibrionales bacterium RIFOXYD1_FULL_44_7]|nr:MAG: hypothetical protein A3K03_12920 [Bdellovibrionales bacterium RIFOXYD1_FULL_44_7]